MVDKNNMAIQREINQNLSVATHQAFALTNEEMEFNAHQLMLAHRSNRRRSGPEKKDQPKHNMEWVNRSTADNIMEIATADKNKGTDNMWVHNVNKDNLIATQQNNKKSSDSLETIRENMINSQESLKARSNESLTIEEAYLRNRSNSIDSLKQRVKNGQVSRGQDETVKRNSAELNNTQNNTQKKKKGSMESLNESNVDLSRSYMHASMKDPHTAAIDLSNNCRQFYFSHLKASDGIKKSVRAAKHTRAREKMEGKPSSSLDNAMDRLRSEMADLMDQDLSLMSQLLKLNDKIEEVKTQMIYRKTNEAFSQSSCYLSSSEVSDSELEDNDDSRLELTQSANNFNNAAGKSKNLTESPEPEEKEVVLRRITPAESDIIIYKKKTRKGKRRRLKTHSRSDSDDDTEADSDTSDTSSHSESTDSTLSCNSCDEDIEDAADCEDGEETEKEAKSDKAQDAEAEPPKQVEGGVSQNRRFLSFLKKNGNTSLPGKSPLLTMQGHNIPLDKYFVPQGLVYLKHSNSDNVFCQFSN